MDGETEHGQQLLLQPGQKIQPFYFQWVQTQKRTLKAGWGWGRTIREENEKTVFQH